MPFWGTILCAELVGALPVWIIIIVRGRRKRR